MALKSNRVGVRTDQVDVYGRITSKSFLQSILDHLPRWTSLKVWKNGTEQLLPVNTDELVTSPIVADIQYPTDSSATGQMFTYRKSPTDADGEAYIQSIKGNTIRWNQLIQNGNFADGTNGFSSSRATITASDGILTITKDEDTTAGTGYARITNFNYVVGHKFLARVDYKGKTEKQLTVFSNSAYSGMTQITPTDENWHTVSKIFNVTALPSVPGILWLNYDTTTDDNIAQFRNYAIFDLTAMFGSTKADEILAMETAQAGSGVAYFTSLFPLPYYKYDAGSLLSFNGTGIKTIGKNQFNIDATDTTKGYASGKYVKQDGSESASSTFNISEYFEIIPNTAYTISGISGSNPSLCFYDIDKNYISGIMYDNRTSFTFTTPSNATYIRISSKAGVQLELGSTATSYEPYTTSTTTIPTDTYFPTGMKSAPVYDSTEKVYDEFASSRAYTRIVKVDLSTISNWVRNGANNLYCSLPLKKVGSQAILCNKLTQVSSTTGADLMPLGSIKAYSTNNNIAVCVDGLTTDNVSTLLVGYELQYELAEEIIEPTLTFDEE